MSIFSFSPSSPEDVEDIEEIVIRSTRPLALAGSLENALNNQRDKYGVGDYITTNDHTKNDRVAIGLYQRYAMSGGGGGLSKNEPMTGTAFWQKLYERYMRGIANPPNNTIPEYRQQRRVIPLWCNVSVSIAIHELQKICNTRRAPCRVDVVALGDPKAHGHWITVLKKNPKSTGEMEVEDIVFDLWGTVFARYEGRRVPSTKFTSGNYATGSGWGIPKVVARFVIDKYGKLKKLPPPLPAHKRTKPALPFRRRH